jgi:hypothetical protein
MLMWLLLSQLPSNCRYLQSHYLAAAVVELFISQSLPNNRTACHNMFKFILTSFPFYTGQWMKILQSPLAVCPFWFLASSSCLLDVLQYLVKPSCCGSPHTPLSFLASLFYPLCLHDQMLIIVSLPTVLTHYEPTSSLILFPVLFNFDRYKCLPLRLPPIWVWETKVPERHAWTQILVDVITWYGISSNMWSLVPRYHISVSWNRILQVCSCGIWLLLGYFQGVWAAGNFAYIRRWGGLIAVAMKSSIFWDITPCNWWKSTDMSEEHVSCLAYSPALKMEATCSSDTSLDFHQTTQR